MPRLWSDSDSEDTTGSGLRPDKRVPKVDVQVHVAAGEVDTFDGALADGCAVGRQQRMVEGLHARGRRLPECARLVTVGGEREALGGHVVDLDHA
jgi:hypothetical protein